jgi:phosphoribosylaminoimidazolecarboxamide formyltransferase / IMP cyclohydrolase
MILIKKALITVSDKTNLAEFARFLQKNGVEIISTGGTREFLNKNNIVSTDITSVTGRPESFGGRVKTLDFNILSSLLFDRNKDKEEAEQLNIEPIDLLVCNFYPFNRAKKNKSDINELIANIDIGGVTLVRAAAKNFHSVTVIVDANDYSLLTQELTQNNMTSSLQTRTNLMVKAFNLVADYDSDIASSMGSDNEESVFRFAFSKYKSLRYGENPHQSASVYRDNDAELGKSLLDQRQLSGKELSYNNMLDLVSALDVVSSLDNYACCVIKHNTPCGIAQNNTRKDLLRLAWEGDSVSSFGSVIAFNYKVEKEDLLFLDFNNTDKSKRKFIEVIAAPGFSDDSLSYLKIQSNLRIISLSSGYLNTHLAEKEFRFIPGGILYQQVDNILYEDLKCVTNVQSIDIAENLDLIRFGIKAVKQIRSNAIVLVRKCEDGSFQLIGQGCGQTNRLNSVKLAIEAACNSIENQDEVVDEIFANMLLISEAFFPFPDSIEYCAQQGIKTIIQPGGSIKDPVIIESCNQNGIGMYFTGIRHFKH